MSSLKALRPADQEKLKNSWQKGQRSCTGKALQGHSSSRTKLTGSYDTEIGNKSSSTQVIALNFTRLHRRHGCARAASLPDSVQDFSGLPCSFENSAYPSVSSTSLTSVWSSSLAMITIPLFFLFFVFIVIDALLLTSKFGVFKWK